jgi:hypothetical protein
MTMRPRDERGWRVPREGTTSRRIYDLLVQGKKGVAIAEITGCDVDKVHVLTFKIRHPETTNATRKKNFEDARTAAKAEHVS